MSNNAGAFGAATRYARLMKKQQNPKPIRRKGLAQCGVWHGGDRTLALIGRFYECKTCLATYSAAEVNQKK
jgi:hypothetical protein